MKDYRYLPQNYLWTLTDIPGEGENGMTISDDNATFHLAVMPYTEDVYNEILAQAAQYWVVEDSVRKTADRNRDIHHGEYSIKPRSIVVNDNRFVGIFTLCTYREESFMHTIRLDSYEGLLFTDGTAVGINRDIFEGSPGGFQYVCDYSLKKR